MSVWNRLTPAQRAMVEQEPTQVWLLDAAGVLTRLSAWPKDKISLRPGEAMLTKYIEVFADAGNTANLTAPVLQRPSLLNLPKRLWLAVGGVLEATMHPRRTKDLLELDDALDDLQSANDRLKKAAGMTS